MLSQTLVGLYLDYLTIHLSGKVAIWFEGYVSGLMGGFHWGLFVEAVCRRFGSRNLSLDEEFIALKQVGGVEEFTEKYEKIRSLLLQERPYLTEEYFLQNYICRLKPTLRCFVRTSLPKTLEDAIWFARQFEQGVKLIESFQKPVMHPRNQIMRANEGLKGSSTGQDGNRIANLNRSNEMDKLREQKALFQLQREMAVWS